MSGSRGLFHLVQPLDKLTCRIHPLLVGFGVGGGSGTGPLPTLHKFLSA